MGVSAGIRWRLRSKGVRDHGFWCYTWRSTAAARAGEETHLPMDPKTSDKLRELAKALLAGKGNRKEIATALANGADRIDELERKCHRIAERALAFWRYRWADGPSPYPTRRREHLSREELDRLPPPEMIESPAKVQAHVAAVHDAMSALDEKARADKRRRVREELAEIKPPPVRPRPPNVPEVNDLAEP